MFEREERRRERGGRGEMARRRKTKGEERGKDGIWKECDQGKKTKEEEGIKRKKIAGKEDRMNTKEKKDERRRVQLEKKMTRAERRRKKRKGKRGK